MAQEDTNTQQQETGAPEITVDPVSKPEEPEIPTPPGTPKSKKVNYYFLFGCIAAFTASVATSATLIALSAPAATTAATLFAATAAVAASSVIIPIAALAAAIFGMILIPLLLSNCFSTRSYIIGGGSMFQSHGPFGHNHGPSAPTSGGGVHHSHPGP